MLLNVSWPELRSSRRLGRKRAVPHHRRHDDASWRQGVLLSLPKNEGRPGATTGRCHLPGCSLEEGDPRSARCLPDWGWQLVRPIHRKRGAAQEPPWRRRQPLVPRLRASPHRVATRSRPSCPRRSSRHLEVVNSHRGITWREERKLTFVVVVSKAFAGLALLGGTDRSTLRSLRNLSRDSTPSPSLRRRPSSGPRRAELCRPRRHAWVARACEIVSECCKARALATRPSQRKHVRNPTSHLGSCAIAGQVQYCISK